MSRFVAALIRHGDYHQLPGVPSAHQPFALNEEGHRQARQAWPQIQAQADKQGLAIARQVDSSPLLRAWQTADILVQSSARSDLTVEPCEALMERGLGIAANLTVAQIEQVLAEDPRHAAPPADWKSNSHYCLPLTGAESLMQAGERVAAHLERRAGAATGAGSARAESAGADVMQLFVGHGAAIRHAAYHLGVYEFERIGQISMFHARPVFLERTGQGQWRHLAGEWKLRGHGQDKLD